MKTYNIIAIVFVIMLMLLAACNYTDNTITPTVPTDVNTATIALTPENINTPTKEPTSSIIEVTATRTIIEVTPNQ